MGSIDQSTWSLDVCATVGQTVTFVDNNSYDYDTRNDPWQVQDSISSRQWDFGDGQGTTVTGYYAYHSYDEPGVYVVKLSVDDVPNYADDPATQAETQYWVTVYVLPTAITVTDDGQYTGEIGQLHASWEPCGLAEYQYAIGTTQGGSDVVGWTTTETCSVTRTGLSLQEGTTYYFAVKGSNGHDCWTDPAYSDGITCRHDPFFFGVQAVPPAAKAGDGVTLTFTASEDLAANPAVTVNGHTAGHVSHTDKNYTYTYQVQSPAVDPPGAAAITMSGTDLAGNQGATTDTSALWIYEAGACSSTVFTYDQNGNRKTMCDSRGVTVYLYDASNRLAGVVDPDGKSIAYSYDSNGRRIGMVDHDGGETAYAYYDNGQIHTITDRDEGVTTFDFYGDGMLQKVTYPNGTYTQYSFDTAGGLSSMANKRSDGTSLASFAFYYDANDDNGNSWPGQVLVTRVDEQVRLPDPNPDNLMASATIHYAYDDQYRVVRERRVGALPFDRSYGYDAVGNRTSLVARDEQGNITSTTSFTHDDVGRILTRGSVTYDYDFDNLTVTRTDGASVRRLSFDRDGRLIRVEDGQQTVAQFAYGGDGDWVSFTDSNQVVHGARYDFGSMIAEETVEDTTHYLLDEIGLLYGASDSTARRYYHFNDMGDTSALTTPGPGVSERWAATYDVFGVISVIDAELLNSLNATQALHFSRILSFTDHDQPFQSGGQAGTYTPPGGDDLTVDPPGDSHIPSDGAARWIMPVPYVPPPLSCPPPLVCLSGRMDPCRSFDGRDWLDKSSDFFAGWGDALTFNATGRVRSWLGVNDVVDENSGWYLGGQIVGTGNAMAIAGPTSPIKGGSHSWRATRIWLGKIGFARRGQYVHHWAIRQGRPFARRFPWFVNQIWNLAAVGSPRMHGLLHAGKLTALERFWYGTPAWVKYEIGYVGGRLIQQGYRRLGGTQAIDDEN